MKKSLMSRTGLILIALVFGVSLMLTPAMACTKTLLDYDDEDGDGIIEVGEVVYFEIEIRTTNPWAINAENVVLMDRFAAELMVVDWHCEGTYEDDPVFSTKGKSQKVFLDWYIGTMGPGQEAVIYITLSTDLNPAGRQEYTSPGCYELNSGAVVKKIYDGVQYSFETGSLYITVY